MLNVNFVFWLLLKTVTISLEFRYIRTIAETLPVKYPQTDKQARKGKFSNILRKPIITPNVVFHKIYLLFYFMFSTNVHIISCFSVKQNLTKSILYKIELNSLYLNLLFQAFYLLDWIEPPNRNVLKMNRPEVSTRLLAYRYPSHPWYSINRKRHSFHDASFQSVC